MRSRTKAEDAERARRYYASHRDERRATGRAYYASHREKRLAYSAEYRKKVRASMKPKLCPCGQPKAESRHHLCPDCRARSAAKRRWRANARRHEASSTARGYGAAHQRLRARWAPIVATGGVACARCGRLIDPGAPWDLDHDDKDRSRYLGPSHSACNRATARHRKEKHDRQTYKSPNW